MDLPAIAPVISELLKQGPLSVLLLYAVYTLYKKVMEVQESRVKDSLEREKTITIALDTAVQEIDAVNDTMKSIRISLEKRDEH